MMLLYCVGVANNEITKLCTASEMLYLGLVTFVATYPVDSIYQSNAKRIHNIQLAVAACVMRLRWEFRDTV